VAGNQDKVESGTNLQNLFMVKAELFVNELYFLRYLHCNNTRTLLFDCLVVCFNLKTAKTIRIQLDIEEFTKNCMAKSVLK
jgi:hypothetical protein